MLLLGVCKRVVTAPQHDSIVLTNIPAALYFDTHTVVCAETEGPGKHQLYDIQFNFMHLHGVSIKTTEDITPCHTTSFGAQQ